MMSNFLIKANYSLPVITVLFSKYLVLSYNLHVQLLSIHLLAEKRQEMSPSSRDEGVFVSLFGYSAYPLLYYKFFEDCLSKDWNTDFLITTLHLRFWLVNLWCEMSGCKGTFHKDSQIYCTFVKFATFIDAKWKTKWPKHTKITRHG